MSDSPKSPTIDDDMASAEYRYRHSRRPEWGEAVVVERSADRCTLRFDDGQDRTIGKRFYHLLVRVGAELEDQDQATEAEPTGESDVEAPSVQNIPGEPELPHMDFQGQLRVFRALYPGGFEDSGYRERYRVRRQGERSKRHVDPLLAAVAHQLGRKAFDRPRSKRSPAEVHKAVLDLLETTSLVAPGELATPLSSYNSRRLGLFATALRNLLFGMQGFELRLERWVEVLQHGGIQPVTWPMVTFLPAVVHPREQLLVRPVLLRRFGANLGQGDRHFRRPTPEGWLWYAKVGAVAQAELTVVGLEPRDLFDVLLFASITLGKEGMKVWKEQPELVSG